MPIIYYATPEETEALIEKHTPGEKLPPKGKRLIICRPYLMPNIFIDPVSIAGKRMFQVTTG